MDTTMQELDVTTMEGDASQLGLPRMLTPEWVADQLAVTPETVKNWCRQAHIRGVKIGKKIWGIPEREYRRFASEDLEPTVSDVLNKAQTA